MQQLILSSCENPVLPQPPQNVNLPTQSLLLAPASDKQKVAEKIQSEKPIKNYIKSKTKKYLLKKCTGLNYISISDSKVLPRAIISLPPFLLLQNNAVMAKKRVLSCCSFGPVKGLQKTVSLTEAQNLLLKSKNEKLPVYLVHSKNTIIQIDVSDQDKSNWFSLLKLGEVDDANVWLKQEAGELYAVTVKPISPRTEIKLGYALEYVKSFGTFDELPTLNLDEVTPDKSYQTWLYERCGCIDNSHKACGMNFHKVPRRKRAPYRCKHCGAHFVRKYTLGRHIQLHCSKKVDTLIIPNEKEQSPQTQPEPTLDDSKLPSDDSLNNFTNNLDFPTNLFDPDRINLDLSIRSDEFGLCALGGRDENCLTELTNDKPRKSETAKIPDTQLLTSCPDCDQIIVNDKRNSHTRLCPATKFKCKCGAKFSNKQDLISHEKEDHKTEENQEKYVCENCNITFKRRGMLVNHMHNFHNVQTTSLDLHKNVVLYECPSCSKVYTTAAKRKSHVYKHHPGVNPKDGKDVKTGRAKVSAVKCTDCYRQYATRIKMMQHWRSCHDQQQEPKDNPATMNKEKQQRVQQNSEANDIV